MHSKVLFVPMQVIYIGCPLHTIWLILTSLRAIFAAYWQQRQISARTASPCGPFEEWASFRGYPRFQYDGYWISTVDPEYWGDDWYDTDDVYVNYVDNGYYLYNRSYPGPGIAINITL